MQLTVLLKVIPPKLEWPFTCQNLRVMKLTAFILLAACLQVAAHSEAQTVTLSKKNATLKSIFAEIRKQTGYDFFYEEKVIKGASRVNIEVTNVSIGEALDICLEKQGISYMITGTTIVLKRKEGINLNIGQTTVVSSHIDTIPRVLIKGKVQLKDSIEITLENVNVLNRNTGQGTTTNALGIFSLLARKGDVLDISYVGLKDMQVRVISIDHTLAINLKSNIREQESVTVYNTGYEQLPKERATGSFEFVSNEELSLRVGTNILSRLEGVSTGLLFDRRQLQEGTNTSIVSGNLVIRGLSTLGGLSSPLIIINNFPYEGDINNINPNDVEKITILKDAAAASIWGARAGNGVIVITTKQGKYNQPTRLIVNSNFNIIQKPDLFAYPIMSSSEFIGVETFLFGKGFYDGRINNTEYNGLSPVVEILTKRRSGIISASDSANQINDLRLHDSRKDYEKYIYRTSVNQQYSLQLNGGNETIRYSLSGGFDYNPSILMRNETNRISLRSDNSFTPFKNLEIQLGMGLSNIYSQSNSLGNIASSNYDYSMSSTPQSLYPYARFVDANGNHLSLPRDYREGYTDTAGNGKLRNWKFRVLDELAHADNTSKTQDILLNLGTSYRLTSEASLQASYQFQRSHLLQRDYKSVQTYYSRNLINLFTQIQGNNIKYIVPNGGVLDEANTEIKSHSGRLQINLNKKIQKKHEIAGIVGGEIRERVSSTSGNRSYGFNKDNLSTSNVDYVNTYPKYGGRGNSIIPNIDYYTSFRDRFVSIYANASYSFDNRYTLSASGRRDASNLFGVDVKNKWKPVWSIGGAWDISKEPFYRLDIIPKLRTRVTFGYQGNVNNALSPYVIIQTWAAALNIINEPYAIITQPANPSLSWETIRQLNIALDFSSKGNRISGSFELYRKKSNNLIYASEVDPTTGIVTTSSNSASMSGKGVDVHLNSINMNGYFKWSTNLLFSYVTNKIIDYKLTIPSSSVRNVINQSGISRIMGKGEPPYGIYSIPFEGLDPVTGDPLGFLGKEISSNYTAMLNQRADTAGLIFHGTTLPSYFGFLSNSFEYKGVSLIINISYKFDYYFRKNTISYSGLYSRGQTHVDFSSRWQKPGDELNTTVPSMVYPANSDRDQFYAGSSANILKADHIRIEYIKLAYSITKSKIKFFPVSNVELYCNLSNLGIIWRSNKQGLDPEFNYGNAYFPPSKNFAIGIKVDF